MPKVTVDLPDIKGYEYTGECRPPNHEYHAWGGDQAAYGTSSEPALILRKLKDRRPINGDDLMKLLRGESLSLFDSAGMKYRIVRLSSTLNCNGLVTLANKSEDQFCQINASVLLESTVEVE